MKRGSLDKILGTEEALVPSSGFLAGVMERVREEAVAPPPIPFPWKRAAPGMVLAAVVLGWGGVEMVRAGMAAARSLTFIPPHLSLAAQRPAEQAGWVAFALAVSLLSWVLSRRLAGRSGLL
jgi:hypothetical protein